jgi:hypothetical protein
VPITWTAFYQGIVESLRIGVAVLQMCETRYDVKWKLLLANSLAARTAGPTVDGFLSGPITELFPQREKHPGEYYRAILRSNKPRVLGKFSKQIEGSPVTKYLLRATPLPQKCLYLSLNPRPRTTSPGIR